MKLIATKRPPNEKTDRVRYVRDDGSSCENAMPRQGVLPHDLIHYVVESRLGLVNGFLSLVARGAEASFVMAQAHDRESAEIESQAVQAEAVVEALQAQLWSGAFDREAFLYGVATASRYRGIEPPALEGLDLERLLYTGAVELQRQWCAMPAYESLELGFRPSEPSSLETVARMATPPQAERLR